MTTEEQIIKLYRTPTGQIWFANGKETPRVGGTSTKFLEHVIGSEQLHFRVLGLHQNAPLITTIYDNYVRAGLATLEVASPMVCENRREREDPEITLYRMRQCLVPASMGGWHTFCDKDYPSYALAGQVAANATAGEFMRTLEQHPVWHDIKFLWRPSIVGVGAVIASILDPRWFVDYQHPERLTRLITYMGLTPGTLERVMRNPDPGEGREQRAHFVLGAWSSGVHLADRLPEWDEPGAFIWRRCRAAKKHGWLRGCQAFLVYLIRTWQQQILPRPSGCDFFAPEWLLKGDEVAAYKAHAALRPES